MDTHTLGDADGLGTLDFQWQRDDGAGFSNVGSDQASYALSDADLNGTVRVVVSYTDGHGTFESLTSAPTAAVTVALNEAPTAGAPTGHYSVSEDGVLVLGNTGLVVDDVDGGAGTETLTLSVDSGVLVFPNGGSHPLAGAALTFTGTIAEINAFLTTPNAILYTAHDDAPPASATLTLTIDDGAATASASAIIDITPVNDPAIISGTVTGSVVEASGLFNTTPGLTTASATLTDTDPDGPADTFQAVAAGHGERQRLWHLRDDRRRHLDLHTRRQQRRRAGAQRRRHFERQLHGGHR